MKAAIFEAFAQPLTIQNVPDPTVPNDGVVIRVEADYLSPLRSGDKFIVTASVERVSKLRFGFAQQIFRLADNQPVLKAKVFGTSLNAQGKPKYFEELESLF